MRIAAIALLLAIIPIALATYGNGTVYSVGSATTSIQGNEGNGTTYGMGQRLDFRPVALGNSSNFDAHIGFFPLVIPTPPAVLPDMSCHLYNPAGNNFWNMIGGINIIYILGIIISGLTVLGLLLTA